MTTRATEPKVAATAGSHGFSLISDEKLFQLYTTMAKCRMIEERARLLLVQSKLRGDGVALGQEASAVGAAIDLLPEDAVVASPTDRIVNFIAGAPLGKIFESLLARASKPELAAQLDNQLNRAMGAALASKTMKNGRISVVFGSGLDASSGSWQEALHVAGAHQLPILFVAPFNLATESAHRNQQAGAQAGGFPVIPVDGNDVVAVYRVATEAITHARKGNGATLIACHFSRSKAHDPIAQMEAYLKRKGLFHEGLKLKAVAGFAKQLDSASAAVPAPALPIRSSGARKPS